MQRVDRRNTRCFPEEKRAGPGSSSSSVNRDKIRFCIYTVLQIPLNASCRNLYANRTAIGTVSEHIHHLFQIFLCVQLRKLTWALNIFSLLFPPEFSYLSCHFFSGEMSPHSRFGSLADLDLDGIGSPEILICHTIFVWNIFKYVFIGSFLFFRKDPSLSTAHRRPGKSGSFCQSHLDLPGHCPKRHVGNIYRILKDHRALGMLSNDRHSSHRSILIQWRRIQLGAENQNVIPVWHLHPCRHGTAY